MAEFINGVAFRPEDWGEEGRKIIRIQNLNSGSRVFNRTDRSVPDKYIVRPYDLLVSWSATLGVYQWTEQEEGLLNQHIFRVLPHEHTDKNYLRHCLSSALSRMQAHLHGATMKHVNRGEFLGTKIPLPPIGEQRRIAAILDQAEELLAKRRAAIALLDQLPQAIFLEMFGDPSINSKRWDMQPMVASCEILTGYAFASPSFVPAGEGVALCRGVNVGINTLQWDDRADWQVTYDSKVSRFELREKDIVLALDRPWISGGLKIATVTSLDLPALLVQRVARIRPTNGSPHHFILEQVRSQRFRNHCNPTETTIPHISPRELQEFSLIQPPMNLQHEFGDRMDAIYRSKTVNERSLAGLHDLVASLQALAFRKQKNA